MYFQADLFSFYRVHSGAESISEISFCLHLFCIYVTFLFSFQDILENGYSAEVEGIKRSDWYQNMSVSSILYPTSVNIIVEMSWSSGRVTKL